MKFSIITVVLNREKAIERTMQSVLSQTCDCVEIEYIVVDGESIDNTVSVVKKWEPKFNGRLKFIQGKDSGLYEALNKGIKASSGDVIGILHAGDVFTDNTIIGQVAEAMTADTDIELVYGDVHYISKHNPNRVSRYYSGAQFTRSRLRMGFAPPHPSMFCRKSVFDTFGLYKENYRVAADFELFARLLWESKVRYAYLNIDMVEMETGGLSTQWHNRIFLNTAELRRALRENNICTSYTHLISRFFLVMIQYIKARKKQQKNNNSH